MKKRQLCFTLFLFCAAFANAQSFEGEIKYHNSFKSKSPSVTDSQYTTMLGNTQDYFIRQGDYKSVTNGTLILWQLYVNADNKIYNKLANMETVYYNDASENADSVLKSTITKNATTIIGMSCDELTLLCNSGLQKYYYSSKVSVDPTLFANHRYGNWAYFLSKSHALPLKMVVDNARFSFESVATEVTPKQLTAADFQLPPGSKTEKSPY